MGSCVLSGLDLVLNGTRPRMEEEAAAAEALEAVCANHAGPCLSPERAERFFQRSGNSPSSSRAAARQLARSDAC